MKNMEPTFKSAFDELFNKYCELLTGQNDPETVEKVQIYALYSHIHKTMPALAKHWIQDNQEGKEKIKAIFEEVQTLNKNKSNP